MWSVRYAIYADGRKFLLHHDKVRLSLHCVVLWFTKLQALVYDVLPPTTAVTGYAKSLQELSADSFVSVLKRQQVCNVQLKLYHAFLS